MQGPGSEGVFLPWLDGINPTFDGGVHYKIVFKKAAYLNCKAGR